MKRLFFLFWVLVLCSTAYSAPILMDSYTGANDIEVRPFLTPSTSQAMAMNITENISIYDVIILGINIVSIAGDVSSHTINVSIYNSTNQTDGKPVGKGHVSNATSGSSITTGDYFNFSLYGKAIGAGMYHFVMVDDNYDSSNSINTNRDNSGTYHGTTWGTTYKSGGVWQDNIKDRDYQFKVWKLPANESQIFVINNSLNFTSDGGQSCGFDGNAYTSCGPTSDTTPTFRFDTVGLATCKLWNQSRNYTDLDNDGISDCSTTSAISHICTFPEALEPKRQTLYISCHANGFEMNTFVDANLFNISINTSSYLTLDGAENNRTYEYETTAELRTSLGFITVYDETNRYVNHSVAQAEILNYTINILRVALSTQNISSGENYTVTIDNRTDLYRAEFNITQAITSVEDDTEDEWNYTGNDMDWSNEPSNATDENWESFASYNLASATAQIYVNYTVPSDVLSAEWKYRAKDNAGQTSYYSCWNGTTFIDSQALGGDETTNYTIEINSSCFSQTKLQIKIDVGAPDQFYEEMVTWERKEGIENLRLDSSNQTILFPGTLIDSKLYQDEFIFSSVNYTSYNLSFQSAETKTIYINYSSQGNSTNRSGYFNFTMTAFELDKDNEFSHEEKFPEGTNMSVTYDGTFHPLGEMSGTNNTWETFANNDTSSRWQGEGEFISNDVTCKTHLFGGDDSCIYDSDSNTGAGRQIYYDHIDLNNVSRLSFQAYHNCHCACTTKLEFTDLTTNVNIRTITQPGCPSSGMTEIAGCNYTMVKLSDTVWNISPDVETGECALGSRDISSLTPPYYIRLRQEAGWTGGSTPWVWVHSFKNFNIGGIYLNKTNTTFTGIEGSSSSLITGNFTTHIINTTTSDVSQAILSATSFTPTGTNITYYLSNDDGATFEKVTLGESHLFSSTGNQIRARFHLESNSNITSPIVLDYTVSVVSTVLSGLDIDVGESGDSIDESLDFELNTSNTPRGFTANDTAVNRYISDNCINDSNCLVPVSFISKSGGILEISSLNLTENINPVRLNITPLQSLNTIQILADYVGGLLKFLDLKFDFRGSKDITVSGHNSTDSINYTMEVVYSPFNLTFPSGQPYWQLFPTARNQSDVVPYGQNLSDGIWHLDIDESYHGRGVDIYVRYNESIDSCVTRNEFRSHNFSLDTNVSVQTLNITNLTTTPELIVKNMTTQSYANIWTYTTINCSGSTSPFIIPYFCFFSLCTGCVQTSDWNSDCGWLV